MLLAAFLLLSASKPFTDDDFDKLGYIKCQGLDNITQFTYYCLIDEVCDSGNKCKKYPEISRNPKYFYLIWFVILCIELSCYIILGWNKNTFDGRAILVFCVEQLSNFIGWSLIYFFVAIKYNLLYGIGIVFFTIGFIILFFIRRRFIKDIISSEYHDLEWSINYFLNDEYTVHKYNITSLDIKEKDGKNLALVKDAIYKLEVKVTYLIYPDQVTEKDFKEICIYDASGFADIMLSFKLLAYISLFFGFSTFYVLYDTYNAKNGHVNTIQIHAFKEGINNSKEENNYPKTFGAIPYFKLYFSPFRFKVIN